MNRVDRRKDRMENPAENKTYDHKKPSEKEDDGFYFFPSRKPGEGKVKEETYFDRFMKGMHVNDGIRCRINVKSCVLKGILLPGHS